MTHLGTQILETPRLVLRPFRLEDAADMYHNWASDPEVTKFLTWPAHAELAVSQAVLAEWVAAYKTPDYYQWAIVPKELGQPIGSISVVQPIDDQIQAAHVGYCIGRPWWHQGYTSEAFSAVIAFLFDQVGVNRVESRHDPRNPNSGLVMQKCGLRYEGILRQTDRNNQGICDAVWYGLLRREYSRR